MEKAQTEGYKSSIQELGDFLTTGSRFPSRRGSTQTSKGKYQAVILRQGFGPAFFSMTGMSQVRGENPQEAPSAGELHSDLQVSDCEVWERRSNSESVA